MKTCLAACALLLMSPALASRAQPLDTTAPSLRDDQPQPAAPAPKRYGDEGSRWLTAGTGFADNLTSSVDVNAHAAVSWFLAPRFEAAVEAAAWHFNQPGDNAGGGSLSAVFRWHFYMTDDRRWSIFADAGIGALIATDNVPATGTGFNFLPRVGAGFTRQLNDEGLRLMAGVRWHHISNARITGADNNPSRDAPMLYAALTWPF